MKTGATVIESMSLQVAEQCESTLSEANREAEGIVDKARAQSAALREEALVAARHEMDALDELWRQKAEVEAAKAGLVVQNEAVGAVLDKVSEENRRIVASDEFPAALDVLLSELMAVAPADVVALAPPDHCGHVREWLANNGHESVSVKGASSMWDGVAVQDRDRTFRISNTLSGRFSRVEQQARRICMMSLFGPEDSDAGSEGSS